jgi:hypothetical protein
MSRIRLKWLLGLCALALLLQAAGVRAQLWQPGQSATRPDPTYYGTQLEAGNLPQLREWLDAGMDPNYVADRIGTGLMIGAWTGNVPMMALLLERGADLERRNNVGERALMHAAWRGQVEAIRFLLARGASINAEPMQWSPLHYAVFGGHKEAAALLLERGADINARSTNGSSVLMMAVYEGHEELARDLVARGADTRIKNDRGEGALEWAFKYKRLGIARIVSQSQQEFVAAASRPRAEWAPQIRSTPIPYGQEPKIDAPPPAPDPYAERIEELVALKEKLLSRGLTETAAKLDVRIARLRAQRARDNKASVPSTVLEISARRGAPSDQSTRIIFETGGPPP